VKISIIVVQAHSGRKRDTCICTYTYTHILTYNCDAGTLGQEKRYMHTNVYTLTHIYMRGEGDEREHIHISGDSSPIWQETH